MFTINQEVKCKVLEIVGTITKIEDSVIYVEHTEENKTLSAYFNRTVVTTYTQTYTKEELVLVG